MRSGMRGPMLGEGIKGFLDHFHKRPFVNLVAVDFTAQCLSVADYFNYFGDHQIPQLRHLSLSLYHLSGLLLSAGIDTEVDCFPSLDDESIRFTEHWCHSCYFSVLHHLRNAWQIALFDCCLFVEKTPATSINQICPFQIFVNCEYPSSHSFYRKNTGHYFPALELLVIEWFELDGYVRHLSKYNSLFPTARIHFSVHKDCRVVGWNRCGACTLQPSARKELAFASSLDYITAAVAPVVNFREPIIIRTDGPLRRSAIEEALLKADVGVSHLQCCTCSVPEYLLEILSRDFGTAATVKVLPLLAPQRKTLVSLEISADLVFGCLTDEHAQRQVLSLRGELPNFSNQLNQKLEDLQAFGDNTTVNCRTPRRPPQDWFVDNDADTSSLLAEQNGLHKANMDFRTDVNKAAFFRCRHLVQPRMREISDDWMVRKAEEIQGCYAMLMDAYCEMRTEIRFAHRTVVHLISIRRMQVPTHVSVVTQRCAQDERRTSIVYMHVRPSGCLALENPGCPLRSIIFKADSHLTALDALCDRTNKLFSQLASHTLSPSTEPGQKAVAARASLINLASCDMSATTCFGDDCALNTETEVEMQIGCANFGLKLSADKTVVIHQPPPSPETIFLESMPTAPDSQLWTTSLILEAHSMYYSQFASMASEQGFEVRVSDGHSAPSICQAAIQTTAVRKRLRKYLSRLDQSNFDLAIPKFALNNPITVFLDEGWAEKRQVIRQLLRCSADPASELTLLNGGPVRNKGVKSVLKEFAGMPLLNVVAVDFSAQPLSVADYFSFFGSHHLPGLRRLRLSLHHVSKLLRTADVNTEVGCFYSLEEAHICFVGNWCCGCFHSVLNRLQNTRGLSLFGCSFSMHEISCFPTEINSSFQNLRKLRTTFTLLSPKERHKGMQFPSLELVVLNRSEVFDYLKNTWKYIALFPGARIHFFLPRELLDSDRNDYEDCALQTTTDMTLKFADTNGTSSGSSAVRLMGCSEFYFRDERIVPLSVKDVYLQFYRDFSDENFKRSDIEEILQKADAGISHLRCSSEGLHTSTLSQNLQRVARLKFLPLLAAQKHALASLDISEELLYGCLTDQQALRQTVCLHGQLPNDCWKEFALEARNIALGTSRQPFYYASICTSWVGAGILSPSVSHSLPRRIYEVGRDACL
ncbi:unnamed protein product [Schistocephalus solidus]|uniref:Protein kinase domain-containing protein n=1 Tax=Schistocephalus solidus TaxID=70667 RepID=A0A183T2J2_SCHSO|nr:unnamed protein product [Schistocephalus solidus]